MKKKVLIGLGIISLAILFIGFGFTKNMELHKEYQRAMDSGITAIKKGEYDKAKIAFQNALKKKQQDATAQRDLNQLNQYLQAKSQFENNEYEKAAITFAQVSHVDDGSTILVRRATAYYMEIEEILKEKNSFNKLYDKALKLSDEGHYSDSNEKLNVILEYHDIDEYYYDAIRQKAKALKKSNDHQLTEAT